MRRFLTTTLALMVGCAANTPRTRHAAPPRFDPALTYVAWARDIEAARPGFSALVRRASMASELEAAFSPPWMVTDVWRQRVVAEAPEGLVLIDDDGHIRYVPAGRPGFAIGSLDATEHHLLVSWSHEDDEHAVLEDRDPQTLGIRRVVEGRRVTATGPGWVMLSDDATTQIVDEASLAVRFERPLVAMLTGAPEVVAAPDGETFVMDGLLIDAHTGSTRAVLDTQHAGFSPDGRSVATSRGGRTVVYDTRNGSQRAETTRCTTPGAPAFSPNGRSVAVGPTPHETVCVLRAADLGLEREGAPAPKVGSGAAFCSPPDAGWSPDGARIYMTKRSDGLDAIYTYPDLEPLTVRAKSHRIGVGKLEFTEADDDDAYPDDERLRRIGAAFCSALGWPVPRELCPR